MSTEVAPGVRGSHFHVAFCKHPAVFQPQYTRYACDHTVNGVVLLREATPLTTCRRYQRAHKVKVPLSSLVALTPLRTLGHSVCTSCPRPQTIRRRRCFPHCCPCHVAHRYCGMALLLVTELSVSHPLESVISLLKIAPADHASWDIGDVLPPQDMHVLEDDPSATWYLGQQELRDDRAVGSLFNHSLVDGWTYGWKSGRRQSVRECMHHATA
ncbi:hypothetical protein ACHHYP_09221 [Achlya hypogyna]|uniref:Uncharacterized protein n=1 Tax=Achlya hypogyna TaxID=1202772 RepID=A0A1V9YNJ7_ACHHY|nr:hypothetical protein ACHHYP_09221 [Achlya hypogyna]